MSTEALFSESSAEPKVVSTPLAHLSIELGHLYAEDYLVGDDRLVQHFKQVRPWVETVERQTREALDGRTARISTCFLFDDYFTALAPPSELIPRVLRAAEANGVRIDYLARESGCARAGETSPAELVEARLVADPAPGTNGSRPPVSEVGWLCNGERSPTGIIEAMGTPIAWAPPRENAVNRHSVFLDVELWDLVDGVQRWSCPFLAAVWQLLRLGLLRDKGAVVAAPQRWTWRPGDDWASLPAVIQLEPQAQSFAAYRTFSVLDARFVHVEHAVRTILGQVGVERIVAEMVAKRAKGEKLNHPSALVDRLEYVFTGRPWRV